MTHAFISEVAITSILKGFDQKNNFFVACFWFKFNNLVLVLGMALEFCKSVEKEFKLKLRKFLGPISTFVEITGEKLLEGL